MLPEVQAPSLQHQHVPHTVIADDGHSTESTSQRDSTSAHVAAVDIAELRRLREETELIYQAINRTKQEIAALSANGIDSVEFERLTRELHAVVGGTERSTEQILAAAENIEAAASILCSTVQGEHAQGVARDIQDHVVRIFEACNFHDITGQRIGKVLVTMQFVEGRIAHMKAIWNGIDAVTSSARMHRPADKLLSGPALPGDGDHVTQSEIDDLFGTN